MAQRYDESEKTVNLLLTSLLIVLICGIIAAMGYFSFTLGILTPPGASDAPERMGTSSGGAGTGIAAPGGADAAAESTQDVGEIIFPGFLSFSITDGRDYLDLKNDAANQVYFRFTISDKDGNLLYATDNVQPGAGERWQVTSAFDPGTGKHDLTITIDAYSVSDGTACNGIRSTLTVDMG